MKSSVAYIPLHALRKIDIDSMLSVGVPLLDNHETQRRFDHHHSRRTMLYYLLSIYKIYQDEKTVNLIKECRPSIDWSNIETTYQKLKDMPEPYKALYKATNDGDYWELKRKSYRRGAEQALENISKYRRDGFQLNELKIYWNYEHIRRLHEEDCYNPETDSDVYQALQKCPVNTRDNQGAVLFIQSGIENAVFQVPKGKQVIVLDFADERMPGGYFLENAHTQEEVILYHSDGYRALLDLKYKVMDGGYMLPEYGVAYIKAMRFFQQTSNEERITDMIVAACYDLSGMGEGLYKPPSQAKYDDLYDRTYQKLQAVIASAVANTEGDGKDTYLLLGPIGTGAFGNDVNMIAGIFSKILNTPMMNSEKAIRHAFDCIWFVSIDTLDAFASAFKNESQ